MPPILDATRCTALLPAQFEDPIHATGTYLMQRRVAAHRAALRGKHAVHADFAAQAVARAG